MAEQCQQKTTRLPLHLSRHEALVQLSMAMVWAKCCDGAGEMQHGLPFTALPWDADLGQPPGSVSLLKDAVPSSAPFPAGAGAPASSAGLSTERAALKGLLLLRHPS